MTYQIDNLTVRFRDIVALHEVSGALQPGKITVLIGPNAGGKSTLLLTMLGVVGADKGSIRFSGRDVRSIPPRELAQYVAYVPQRGNIAARFSVRDVIELGRYAHARDPRRVDDVIEEFDLGTLVDRPFATLSVGQQQRVTLARACAQAPADGVMLLDEPTSAMDLRYASLAVRALRKRVEQGMTALVVLHDFMLISALAMHVWLLDDGRLVRAAPAGDVLSAEVLRDVFSVDFFTETRAGGLVLPDIAPV